MPQDITIKNGRLVELRGVQVLGGLAIRVVSIGKHHEGNRTPVPFAVLEVGEPAAIEITPAEASTDVGERIAAKYDGQEVFDDVTFADDPQATASEDA